MIKKKINLFALEDLAKELPEYFDYWEKEIAGAEPIFQMEGEKIEKLARDLPHNQVHYAQLALEAKAVVKWLEIQKGKAESRYIKNYNNSPRALGVKEQSIYLQGEKEVIELNQLIVDTALKQCQLEEIVEGIKQMGWMIGNIVKLRVADIQEMVI